MESVESIVESLEGSVKVVMFNKPNRKNAIDDEMYVKVKKILDSAAINDDISTLVLTGAGDFFSSGNDFKAKLMQTPLESNFDAVLYDYVKAFITFPKLLIAIVNGPAIGIAATTLPLFDLVFASEKSYFYTPFMKLGIIAEGCSTYTFPRLIGERKAAEMLLFNHKMSAQEALDCGFVNYLYRPEELQSKVWDKIVEVSNIPTIPFTMTKKLMKGVLQNELLSANKAEIEGLVQLWTTGMRADKSKL